MAPDTSSRRRSKPCARAFGAGAANDAQFARVDASACAALIETQVASTMHRFDDARCHLTRASEFGAPREVVERQSLTIDRAIAVELEARRRLVNGGARVLEAHDPQMPLLYALPDQLGLERRDMTFAI